MWQCGFTPQYKDLEALHEKYGAQGLCVVGFPCNQFGAQEPGTAEEIREFCSANYGVKFDLFAKVEVNGDGACDLYKHLTALDAQPKGAGKVSWNFEKFLVGRDGKVVARVEPRLKPTDPLVRIARKRTAEVLGRDLQRARETWLKESPTPQERKRREQTSFLAYQNDQGHYVDFHALRKTFITNLSRAGV